MSLFSELKRRNVFRTGVAYLIVAWLLMQVTDLAAPRLFLPDWVPTFVIFILSLGFPVALLLAWAFEVTPEGIKKTEDVPLEKSIRRMTGQKLNYVFIALLSIAVVVLLTERIKGGGSSASIQVASDGRIPIAVLPFDNLSDDPDQEHFVDGLTEELLNSLAAIDEFRVISRTSSFTYKGKDVPISQIASELGVSHVLEGSVRRIGDRIRVTAQLIDTNTDSHIWFENFDRELTVDNLLDIQEIVSRTVADRLQVQLAPDEHLSTAPANLEALDLYHDGTYYVRRMQLGDYSADDDRTVFEASVEALEASIEADPNWAPSHATLGMAYHFNMHLDDQAEKLRKSREHIERSLEIDPTFGQAHNSLGYINTVEGNTEAAMASYDLARRYYDRYHWGLAILLFTLGRYDEAVEEYLEARRLDPLSTPVHMQLMIAQRCAGQYRSMLDEALTMLRLEPDSYFPKAMLAQAYIEIGDTENALRYAEELAASERSDLRMAFIFARAGQFERARAALDSDEATSRWLRAAPAAVVLGETDRALDILETAFQRTEPEIGGYAQQFGHIRCVPALMSLAGNPRFDALMEKLDLPE